MSFLVLSLMKLILLKLYRGRMIKINSIFSWFITSSFTSLQNPHVGNDCFWHKINRIRDIYGNAGYIRR